MTYDFRFNSIPRVTFNPGSSDQLPEICQQLNIRKPLLVTDQGVMNAGILDAILSTFASADTEVLVYSDVLADPPAECALTAQKLASEKNCDGVIGFGGGSPMDVAKLAALLMNTDQPLEDMYGVEQVKGERLPLIQVPTTSGTGSEATAVAVMTTGETTKAGVASRVLYADHIVLDPLLTLGLPPHVTAATGIDAMVHAIEAYTSKIQKNPLSDMAACKALTLLSGSIETAVKEGDNIEARSNMLLGAMLAGQAFANAPVAAVHALAYPLGGIYHIPHGLSNALVLPEVLKFNATVAEPLYAELMDVINPQNNLGSDKQKTQAFIEYLANLIERVNLPTRLRDAGVEEAAIPQLAADAMLQQRLLINNPVEVTEVDALNIYSAAY